MAQKNKKVEDKIMDKWGNEESEVLIPAGNNIFGQPTEPMTKNIRCDWCPKNKIIKIC